MKFTQVATDAFQKFQLNAGIILTEFDPTDPDVDKSKILFATSGGTNFTAAPEYEDFGEDVDNVPANTKELKVLQSVTVTMSGTAKTVDSTAAQLLMASATATTTGGVTKLVPNADLLDSDFNDLWWVGDYSDKHGATNGGFMAIHMLNALSDSGFSLQSNDKGKADFEFSFVGHYSLSDITKLPYEIYIMAGSDEPTT